jgi:4'-phosphopantetheinyl transferase
VAPCFTAVNPEDDPIEVAMFDLQSPERELARLGRGEAHLWLAQVAGLAPSTCAAMRAVLSGYEQSELARRLRPADQQLYLVAHALLRLVIGHCVGEDPRAVALGSGEHGKPFLIRAAGGRALEISLTHSGGIAACAVTSAGPVGVDVEAVDRKANPLDIAERFFAPGELAALQLEPAERCRRRFFLLWTLKEAVLKVLGTGLTVPLSSAAFDLEPGGEARLTLTGPLEGAGTSWCLAALCVGRSHVLAIAADSVRHALVKLRWRQVLEPGAQAPLAVRCLAAGMPPGRPGGSLRTEVVPVAKLLRGPGA